MEGRVAGGREGVGRVKVEETTVESIVILSYFELLVCTQIYHIRSRYCMNDYIT